MNSKDELKEPKAGPAEKQLPSPAANVEIETTQQLPAPHVEPVAGSSASAPAPQTNESKRTATRRKSKTPARSSAYQSLSRASNNINWEGEHCEPPLQEEMEEFNKLCDEAKMHIRSSIELLLQPREPAPLFRPPSKLRTRCITGHWQPGELSFEGTLGSMGRKVTYVKELHEALIAAAKESLVAE